MVKDDRIGSALCGAALFVAAFASLNVLARLRRAGFDANLWWIDFRPLPAGVAALAVAAVAILLGLWAVRPRMGRWQTAFTVALVTLAIGVALYNVVTFYRLRAAHRIGGPVAAPFSLLVVVGLLLILRRMVARPIGRLHRLAFVMGGLVCLIGFPLAQIAAFGLTDYRRPADAIVVFGARAHADGQPSDALADRVATAIELYQQGLAPRLIFSGGPGDGALTEAQVMRNLALAAGVPASAITLDDRGLTTDATIRNAAELLDVAHRPRRCWP